MKTTKEFVDFLKEFQIVGLAIGFVMGAASTSLIKSLVDNIIMPFLNPLLNNGMWREAYFSLGSIQIRWGAFLGELINFLILALVVFIIVKKLLKWHKSKK